MALGVCGVHAGPVIMRHPFRAGALLVAGGVVLAVVAEIFWLVTGGYDFSASGTPTQEQLAEIQRTDHLAAGLGVAAVIVFRRRAIGGRSDGDAPAAPATVQRTPRGIELKHDRTRAQAW
jgi:hypothetical protein